MSDDLFGPLEFNVLSLFDGMSCGQIALNRTGVPYDKYFASEIDKNAIKVTQHNYPNTIQIGDVTKVSAATLPNISLLMGGSPCQGFSSAGRGLNFDDPRSALFFEFVRLKNELNPKYFLLENVEMKKEWRDIISEYLGVDPVFINSIDFCAQSRQRWYWTNLPIAEWGKGDFDWRDIQDHDIRNLAECIVPKTPSRETMWGNGKNGKCVNLGNRKTTYALTTKMDRWSNAGLIPFGEWCRFLTPLECERLQTVPDNYTAVVSRNARYHMLGNGWTVDVIAHILQGIKVDNQMRLAA